MKQQYGRYSLFYAYAHKIHTFVVSLPLTSKFNRMDQLNQTNKLVWVVETIRKARKISFEELNEKRKDAVEFSGGDKLVKRTFHKWRDVIFKTFGIIIDCEKFAPYYYFIFNEEELKNGSVGSWLFQTYAVCNSLIDSKSIKDRILLENVPSGRDYLQPIIEAMKAGRFIHFKYYSYSSEELSDRYVMPLCVKLFRQRWYMVGRMWPANRDVIFSVDRMSEFRLSSHTFDYPEDFSPEDFFYGCFGIINDENCEIQTVKLRVSSRQAKYLRDVPLHKSQTEVERTSDHSIFSLRVRPTFDFVQELLWNREELEVLEPLGLRREMSAIVKKIGKLYAK